MAAHRSTSARSRASYFRAARHRRPGRVAVGAGARPLAAGAAAGLVLAMLHAGAAPAAPGVLAGDYDAASSRLTLRWVCGPAFGDKATCGYGDTVWSTTFTAYGAPHLPPRPPALVGPAVANGPVRAADPPAGAAPRSPP